MPRKSGPNLCKAVTREKLVELLAQGMGVSQIARELGYATQSRRAIYNLLRKHNITLDQTRSRFCANPACGKPIVRKEGEKPSTFNVRRYCDKACHFAGRPPKIDYRARVAQTKMCKGCVRPFHRRIKESDEQWSQRQFCGQKCSSMAHAAISRANGRAAVAKAARLRKAKKLSGEQTAYLKNPFYRPNIRPPELPPGSYETVEQALARGVKIQRIEIEPWPEKGGCPAQPTYPRRAA